MAESSDDGDQPIIEGVVWNGPIPTEAVHYDVMYDDELGCLAVATTPTGERFYGFDGALHGARRRRPVDAWSYHLDYREEWRP